MVKGISKQILVVHSPDRRFFEQAIFILREDALGKTGVTDEEILREAGRVADGYARRNATNGFRLRRVPAPILVAAGALAVGVAWMLSSWL